MPDTTHATQERLRKALERLADTGEALAGSDPLMASHDNTVAEFDAALEHAREVLAATEPD